MKTDELAAVAKGFSPDGSMDSTQVPHLVAALEAAAGSHPNERKVVICRRFGEGRELLRAVAAHAGGWVGFSATTPYALALELAAVPLAEDGLEVADEFEELALLDEAIESTLESAPPRLRELAETVGLRQAMGEAVRALRLAGVAPDVLRRARLRDREKRDALVRILTAYESDLWDAKLADAATVFRRATTLLDGGGAALPPRIYLVPGHGRRGVSGAFLDELVARGAVVLKGDPVMGLATPSGWLRGARSPTPPPGSRLAWLHSTDCAPAADSATPAVELFTAASVTDELREVLRRVLSTGLRWDEVEIVATEPVAYGAALDAIARRLGIPVTYAVGLPFERTRPGRVVSAYLRWIGEDFPDDVLRALLERGDIAPPRTASSAWGPALARRLRRMRIGRGHDRYEAALGAAERRAELSAAREDEGSAEQVERQARERDELAGLAAVIRPVLGATPEVPDRLGVNAIRVRPADLAQGLLALLRLVPSDDGVDATAHRRLVDRLERLERTTLRPTTLAAATAILLSKLETRVPAPDSGGPAPWSSAGGHLHLCDVTHGGYTGRKATFLVGLDAGRFPGAGVQDPLLTDEDRRAIGGGGPTALPTTVERLEEKRFALAELLARLRGSVTLSYSAWDAAETRMVPPAAEMLQAHRLATGDPLADYERLHGELPMASAVPRRGVALDAADVWLRALYQDGILRQGENVVREVFRPLDRGLRAAVERQARELTPHHGRIAPRPSLDPRRNPEVVVSASRLEALGACPRRYLLRYVLGVWPPDDPDMQPDRWLSPLDRGSLLHTVYERTLTEARNRSCEADDVAFEALALEVLREQVELWREMLPPPGRAVYEVELAALIEDARAFVEMVRTSEGEWIALERMFGRGGEESVELQVPGGPIRMMGAIDRIDRLPDGGLVIIDYKTGSPYEYGRRHGTYNGGRRLQHALYAAVAERLFDEPVVRAEYHFPTVRGKNMAAEYAIAELTGGITVVDRLLDLVAQGHLFPTNEPNDCKFCDYRVVCRVEEQPGVFHSPAAEWTKQAGELEELNVLRELRPRS